MRIRKQKSLIDRAQDYVESVAETVIPQLEAAYVAARDQVGPALSDAREKAGPALADARDRAVPLLQDARDKAAPVIAEGRALAAEKAAAGAAVAAGHAATSRDFAAAKVAEFRAEPEPQGSKLKKVLFIGGLLAIGGAVFSKLKQSGESSNWQSSYVPTPPPAPAATAPVADPAAPAPIQPLPTDSADDVAGSDPSEAISDAAEAPHDVTTPDAPAEIIDVDDVPENKS
ncbi:MAG: hypothetical protein ABIR39_00190 [Nocardioides sp.]|uniref:hypothetical protein n=1 Tax=Nocardioides sp. TaxID=35761 RepID=UPI003262EF87